MYLTSKNCAIVCSFAFNWVSTVQDYWIGFTYITLAFYGSYFFAAHLCVFLTWSNCFLSGFMASSSKSARTVLESVQQFNFGFSGRAGGRIPANCE